MYHRFGDTGNYDLVFYEFFFRDTIFLGKKCSLFPFANIRTVFQFEKIQMVLFKFV